MTDNHKAAISSDIFTLEWKTHDDRWIPTDRIFVGEVFRINMLQEGGPERADARFWYEKDKRDRLRMMNHDPFFTSRSYYISTAIAAFVAGFFICSLIRSL